MPKRYSRRLESEVEEGGGGEEKLKSVQNLETISVPRSETRTQRVVTSLDAVIKVTGMYSGQEYVFDGAGSVVDVDERDVEWMLERRQGGRQCCGGTEYGTKIFHLAEETIHA